MTRDTASKDFGEAGHRGRHVVGPRLPQTRRPLDVSEQERDHAGRHPLTRRSLCHLLLPDSSASTRRGLLLPA